MKEMERIIRRAGGQERERHSFASLVVVHYFVAPQGGDE
jgi:hypothetical protein